MTAQTPDYFAGKTLRIVVGLEAGGTADVFIRSFSVQLRKHIPGNPTVVVQNMTGAGGSVASNYTYESAAPDGLTIVFNTSIRWRRRSATRRCGHATTSSNMSARSANPRQLHAGRRRTAAPRGPPTS